MAAAYKQDMAPKGGYPEIKIARNLPRRGPSGLVTMLGGVAVMAVGFYGLSRTNRQRRYYERVMISCLGTTEVHCDSALSRMSVLIKKLSTQKSYPTQIKGKSSKA